MSFQLYGAKVHVPPVLARALATGEEYELGSLLVVNGSGEYEECGADPASIAAVSLTATGVGSGPLYPVGRKEFPEFEAIGLLVEGQTFTAQYVGTIGTPQTAYGVTKGADGIWRVDFGKTGGTARVLFVKTVLAGPSASERVAVRVLVANIQIS